MKHFICMEELEKKWSKYKYCPHLQVHPLVKEPLAV